MPYCFDPSAAVAVVNNDPYESCPVFEHARYCLRLVNMDDAVDLLAVYVPPIATERQKALERLGFIATDEMLVGGHDGKRYSDYFVLFTS